jgi:hypothetical protein
VGLGGTVPGTGGFDDGCAVSTGPVAAVVIGVAALWKWSMTLGELRAGGAVLAVGEPEWASMAQWR